MANKLPEESYGAQLAKSHFIQGPAIPIQSYGRPFISEQVKIPSLRALPTGYSVHIDAGIQSLQLPPSYGWKAPVTLGNQIDFNFETESPLIRAAEEPAKQMFFRRFSQPFVTLSQMYGKKPLGNEVSQRAEQQLTTYPTGLKWFLLLLCGTLPYIIVVLDDTIVATIIPILVAEFHAPSDIGWYASAYFLPLTVLMPLFGKCYSLWKIKWLFFFSLNILLVGSIICATAVSSPMFIAGRATSGTGAAGIINGAMRIIGVSSPRKERIFLEAAGALVMGACTVSGPILGGVMADNFGWRWAFWLNVPIAIGSLVIILTTFPAESQRYAHFNLPVHEKIKRLDPIGACALIASLASLIVVLQSYSTSIELSRRDMILAIVSGASLLVFAFHETFVRPDLALIPRRIFVRRAVWSCCLMLFLLFAGFINFIFFLSIFFQSVKGQSAQSSAISLLPYIVGVSVASVVTGVAVPFVRYYNPFFLLGGICFSVGAGFILIFNEETSLAMKIGYEGLLGFGVGFLMLANLAPCHILLDEKDHSIANGLTFLCSLLGSTISVPVSSALFNRILISRIESLDITLSLKASILEDPTKVHSLVPKENLSAVLSVLVSSIRRTFLFGLCCAIACSISSLLVSWRPVMSFLEQEGKKDEPPQIPRIRPISAIPSFTMLGIEQGASSVQSIQPFIPL